MPNPAGRSAMRPRRPRRWRTRKTWRFQRRRYVDRAEMGHEALRVYHGKFWRHPIDPPEEAHRDQGVCARREAARRAKRPYRSPNAVTGCARPVRSVVCSAAVDADDDGGASFSTTPRRRLLPSCRHQRPTPNAIRCRPPQKHFCVWDGAG